MYEDKSIEYANIAIIFDFCKNCEYLCSQNSFMVNTHDILII